jgi:xylose isomerase
MLGPSSSLAAIADSAVREGIDPRPRSGRQELLENVVARFT